MQDQLMASDPIHEDSGSWYFWDETWGYRYGPYNTEEDAAKELSRYCTEMLGD